MGDRIITEISLIIASIVGLATVAVILSNHANTANVISAASSGLATDIKAAVAPVSS
jgi:hypothetical protein